MSRVLLRADASRQLGTGHVVRSIAVANALAAAGTEVVFASGPLPPELVARLRRAGHRLCQLDRIDSGVRPGDVWSTKSQLDDASLVRSATRGLRFDSVVVDHYGLDSTWEHAVADVAELVVAIDDLANRPHSCDLLVDHNWYGSHTAGRYDGLIPDHCTPLLGPRYALLQPPYRILRESRQPPKWPPERVVVSYGGTDPTGESTKVMHALKDPAFDDLLVDVVVGTREAATEEMRSLVAGRNGTALHVAVPTLAPLLVAADLALGASGTATWERMCLGVPGLVTTSAPHQSGVTEALASAGVTRWIGLNTTTTPERYREVLLELLNGPAPTMFSLVDGYGPARVSLAMGAGPSADATTRRAVDHDLPTFIGHDPGTGPEDQDVLVGSDIWSSRTERFSWRLAHDPGSQAIALIDDIPVGTIDIDPGLDFTRAEVVLQRVAGQTHLLEATIAAVVQQFDSPDVRSGSVKVRVEYLSRHAARLYIPSTP